MKLKHTVMVMAVFLGVLLGSGPTGLFAQETDEVDLQALVIKKYDADLDGSLSGFERDGAIGFLKRMDRNGDDQIVGAERTAAINALNRMPDPKAKVAVKPIKKRATLGGVMKGVKAGEKEMPDPRVPREGIIPKITIGPRPTAESIAKRGKELEKEQNMRDARRNSMRRRVAPSRTTPGAAQEPVVKQATKKKKGYYDGSIIIAVSGVHTVVPHGSVLHVPPDLAGTIVKKPTGKLMRWPEFLQKHSKWIKTRKVSWETVTGSDPINEDERKTFAKGNKVIVAVFGKNPITVLEPPPKEVEGSPVKGAVGSDTKKRR